VKHAAATPATTTRQHRLPVHKALQIFREFESGLITLLGIELEGLEHDAVELAHHGAA